MKKIICSIILTISASASGMIENREDAADHAPFDDSKEFTPQILTRFKAPQPLLDAACNSKNKKALRYLGLRLYNRRVAPLNNEGKGDFLYFGVLETMKTKVSISPTEVTIQNLAHWLSRKPIPTGKETLKKEADSLSYGSNSWEYHFSINHPGGIGDFCETICKQINHIALNEDWTPNKTESVMVEFLKIYLNITSSNVSSDTTTKGK